ncbi:low molecular weight phosphotyrosine protein phosphatase 1-like [Arctopsyche grandis]|uniref:low molecular weight phosphotyrosine protein phosphatase 1-like n=1 Tax=Arctopsyche grandis TaxID=121162 RepID=UPI00406D850C
MASADTKKALFICLGNICRSPIAEGVFIKTVKDSGQADKWEIDSAALGSWHVGNHPDYRALDVMKSHHVQYSNRARQIKENDFHHYDFIFGMDEENMRELKRRSPKNSKAQLLMLGDFDPEGDRIIRDPYYDDDSHGFEKCYQQSTRCCKVFLEKHS